VNWNDILTFLDNYGDMIFHVVLCIQLAILTCVVMGKKHKAKKQKYKLNT
jgi:hypothetical protein